MLLNGIVAAVITMIITIIGIPRFIMFFHKKKLGGQPTLEDVKRGIPMIVIIIVITAATIPFNNIFFS